MDMSKQYSAVNIDGTLELISSKYYDLQQEQFWTEHEVDFTRDRDEYPNLDEKHKKLYLDILAFFLPADGVICENVGKLSDNCKTLNERSFYIIQEYIELVHGKSYGFALTSVVNDEKSKEYSIKAINDTTNIIRKKTDFILKYMKNDSYRIKCFASACMEGIFFVTLFAIVFYFKGRNIFNQFVILNEKINKDETLHRDFYCEMVSALEEESENDEKIMGEIAKEAVKVEILHLKHILGSYGESDEGLTVENLSNLAKVLANDIMVLCGYKEIFDAKHDVYWMNDIGMSGKTNFLEKKAVTYRATSKKKGQGVDLSCVKDLDF